MMLKVKHPNFHIVSKGSITGFTALKLNTEYTHMNDNNTSTVEEQNNSMHTLFYKRFYLFIWQLN